MRASIIFIYVCFFMRHAREFLLHVFSYLKKRKFKKKHPSLFFWHSRFNSKGQFLFTYFLSQEISKQKLILPTQHHVGNSVLGLSVKNLFKIFINIFKSLIILSYILEHSSTKFLKNPNTQYSVNYSEYSE